MTLFNDDFHIIIDENVIGQISFSGCVLVPEAAHKTLAWYSLVLSQSVWRPCGDEGVATTNLCPWILAHSGANHKCPLSSLGHATTDPWSLLRICHNPWAAGPLWAPYTSWVYWIAMPVGHGCIPFGMGSPKEQSGRRCCSSTRPTTTKVTSCEVDL
jgi:hypothetical protein